MSENTPSVPRRGVRLARRKVRGLRRRVTATLRILGQAGGTIADAFRVLLGKNRREVLPPPYRYLPGRQGTPIAPPDIVIRDISAEMGRGVFAARAFAEGETVEVAPIMLMLDDWYDLPAECRVRVFGWHLLTDYEGLAYALPFGYGTFFNHSRDPNLRYEGDDVEQTITYIARRDIDAGEELSIHYDQPDGVHTEIAQSWFEGLGIVEEGLD